MVAKEIVRSALHQQGVVGDGQFMPRIVRREDNGEAVILRQSGDLVEHEALVLEIERRRRLIKDDDIRL